MINETEIYNSASELTKSGHINDAKRLYGNLLSNPMLSNSVRAKVFNDLGRIFYSSGEVQKARLFFEKAVFADALCEDGYRNLMSVNASYVGDKKRFKFSVVISTYNRYPELKKCIESIRRNSYYPIEIIIVCDPCADGTVEYLKLEDGKEITSLIRNHENH